MKHHTLPTLETTGLDYTTYTDFYACNNYSHGYSIWSFRQNTMVSVMGLGQRGPG
jgi:hypothetical protein